MSFVDEAHLDFDKVLEKLGFFNSDDPIENKCPTRDGCFKNSVDISLFLRFLSISFLDDEVSQVEHISQFFLTSLKQTQKLSKKNTKISSLK